MAKFRSILNIIDIPSELFDGKELDAGEGFVILGKEVYFFSYNDESVADFNFWKEFCVKEGVRIEDIEFEEIDETLPEDQKQMLINHFGFYGE